MVVGQFEWDFSHGIRPDDFAQLMYELKPVAFKLTRCPDYGDLRHGQTGVGGGRHRVSAPATEQRGDVDRKEGVRSPAETGEIGDRGTISETLRSLHALIKKS